jgi:superfamily II DNA or RNA helicase
LIRHCQQNPNHKTLGVTATPDRTDERAMGEIFDSVAYQYDIVDGVKDGWLVPIRQRSVYVEGLDYSKIRTKAGDLHATDLAAVMEEERHLHAIASPTLELAEGKQVLVFVPSVKCAESLADIFNRHTPDIARWVCGTTPALERYHSVQDYKEGRAKILVNVGVFTEGFDAPATEVIVLGRPTKSRSLFCQMVGRGTRTLPGIVDAYSGDDEDSAAQRRAAVASSGKPFVQVLDFVGNAGRHKLVTPMDILGGDYDEDVVARANTIAAETNDAVDTEEVLAEAAAQLAQEREDERRREAASRAKLVAQAKYTTKEFNPFDVLDIERPPTSRGATATIKQCKLLLKFGVDATEMDQNQAQKLIKVCFGRARAKLCTIGQARVLKRYGYSADCTKVEAGKILDNLKSNGWKR